MVWRKKEKDIREIFRIGIIIKWVFASLQLIGGVLLFIISKNTISNWLIIISQQELIVDPRDYIATYLFQLGTNFSLSVKLIIASYLVIHGAIKIYLLYGLWKNKLGAYPLSAIVFSIFLLYQLYRYLFSHSILLLVLCIIDIVYIYLILHEYKILRKKKVTT